MKITRLKLLICITLIEALTISHVDSRSKWVMDDAAGSQQEDELTRDESVDNRAGCAACISSVGLLQNLVEGNATYDELRNASISVCYVLVPSEGWDPATLCDLAIDTYAPHVIYILNVTAKTPREICTLYNNCPSVSMSLSSPPGVARSRHQVAPSDVADGRSSSSSSTARRRRTAAEWKAANYTGTLRLVHVTDIHTDYMYAEGSPTECQMPLCCRAEYSGTGSARYWGDYPCNIPHRTVDLLFSDIAQRFRPHIVAYTGDSVQHTVWDQPLDQTIDVHYFITERLSHWLPDSASYACLGNHDSSPTNLFYANRPEIQILNEAVFNFWKPLSGFGSEQWSTFSRGAYYTIDYRAGLRIVSYNSNYGSLENFYCILNVDEPDYYNMKQFLEDTLASARQAGEKVILLGHHPTGSDGYLLDYGRFITDVHARYSDVIILHLMGHGHSDSFAIVRDFGTGEARGVQLSSPSMTSYTDINPSYRVIYLDPDTFEPLDIDTYHLDLNVDADNPTPDVKFVYRMSDEYGMPDMTAGSFNDFVNRMENDRSLMEVYRYNQETRVYRPGPCDDTCAARMLCNLRNTDSERRQECFDSIEQPKTR